MTILCIIYFTKLFKKMPQHDKEPTQNCPARIQLKFTLHVPLGAGIHHAKYQLDSPTRGGVCENSKKIIFSKMGGRKNLKKMYRIHLDSGLLKHVKPSKLLIKKYVKIFFLVFNFFFPHEGIFAPRLYMLSNITTHLMYLRKK